VVLWLAFVDTLDRHELLLGLFAAAVGATAQELVNAQDLVRFRLEPGWLRDLRLLPRQVVADSWLLAVVLVRQLARGDAAGAFRTVPFPAPAEASRAAGMADDARANARRALVTAAVSLTPNTYVVGIEGEDGTMLVHQLAPTTDAPVPPSMLAGARPAPPGRERP
jgi:multisubunit Na+/H+ antiporter MnhE subunit